MIYRLPGWLAFQGEDELLDESHTIIYIIYIIWLKAMCICKLDTGTCSNWSDSKNIIEYRLIFGSRHVCFIYPPWNQYSAWTWMVGILVSFLGWPIFRGELLVSGRVNHYLTDILFHEILFKYLLLDNRIPPKELHLSTKGLCLEKKSSATCDVFFDRSINLKALNSCKATNACL